MTLRSSLVISCDPSWSIAAVCLTDLNLGVLIAKAKYFENIFSFLEVLLEIRLRF